MELAELVDPEMMIKIKRDKSELIRKLYELCFLSGESVTIVRSKGNNFTVEGTSESGNIYMRGKANEIKMLEISIEKGEGDFDLTALKKRIKLDKSELVKQELYFRGFLKNSLQDLRDRFGLCKSVVEEEYEVASRLKMERICSQLMEYYKRKHTMGIFLKRCLEDVELWMMLWDISIEIPEQQELGTLR